MRQKRCVRFGPLFSFAAICLAGLSGCHRPMGMAQQAKPSLDARDFLCDFAQAPRRSVEQRRLARAKISAVLRPLGLTALEQRYDGERGVNLYAILPATETSDAWIVVGAHYDTVKLSPGADDDGSGVTGTLLAAERLVSERKRKANVIFVFFDEEELGTIGSGFFVQLLVRNRHKVLSAHLMDMIGWNSGQGGIELANGSDGGDASQDRYFIDLYARAAAMMHYPPGAMRPTDMGRSDHVPFIDAGYRAVLVSQPVSESMPSHYHRPNDTCEKVDYGYLRMIATLVATAVTIQLQ